MSATVTVPPVASETASMKGTAISSVKTKPSGKAPIMRSSSAVAGAATRAAQARRPARIGWVMVPPSAPFAALGPIIVPFGTILQVPSGTEPCERPRMKDASAPASDPFSARFGPLARHLFDDAPLAAIWRLSALANFYTGPLYARLQAEHGLGRPGFVVLYCLSEREDLMARDVVRASGLPKNSVSRAVTALVAQGLVVADEDGGDRRAKPLRFTARGAALMAELMPLFATRQAELLAPLTVVERDTLRSLLAKMAGHLPHWVDRTAAADEQAP